MIMSSDICHSQVKNYSNKMKQTSTIAETLSDILHLNRVPKVGLVPIRNDALLTAISSID